MPTAVTKTLKSTGGDYTSFSAWQSAQADNITAAGVDEIHTLECYVGTTTTGNWDSSGRLDEAIDISGWTTDSTHFITIKAADGERHDGSDITSGFTIRVTSGFTYSITIRESYTVIDGVGIDCNALNSIYGIQPLSTPSNVTLSGLILDSAYQIGVSLNSDWLVYNCLVTTTKASSTIGIRCPGAIVGSANMMVYNNTVIGAFATAAIQYGANGYSGHSIVKNNVSYGCASGKDFVQISGASDNADYCATDQASGTSGLGTGINNVFGIVSTTGTDFTDYSSGDYSVAGTGSALYDAGTDLSGTFTDDITGATRSQWDIGAYEYVSVGGVTASPFGHQRLDNQYSAIAASRLNGVLQ